METRRDAQRAGTGAGDGTWRSRRPTLFYSTRSGITLYRKLQQDETKRDVDSPGRQELADGATRCELATGTKLKMGAKSSRGTENRNGREPQSAMHTPWPHARLPSPGPGIVGVSMQLGYKHVGAEARLLPNRRAAMPEIIEQAGPAAMAIPHDHDGGPCHVRTESRFGHWRTYSQRQPRLRLVTVSLYIPHLPTGRVMSFTGVFGRCRRRARTARLARPKVEDSNLPP